MNRIKNLQGVFQDLSFQHIFREFNRKADALSKEALGFDEGLMAFKQFSAQFLGPITNWQGLFPGVLTHLFPGSSPIGATMNICIWRATATFNH